MTNVYFLEAADHTAPAVSCAGKTTILAALVMLKIKCYRCNLEGEEREGIEYFLFIEMGYYFKACLYTVLTLYMCVLLQQ